MVRVLSEGGRPVSISGAWDDGIGVVSNTSVCIVCCIKACLPFHRTARCRHPDFYLNIGDRQSKDDHGRKSALLQVRMFSSSF